MTSALRGSRLAPPAAVLVVLLLAAAGGVRGGSGGNAAAGSRKLVAGGSGNSAALAELVKDSPHASAEGEALVVKDSAPSSASGDAAEKEALIPPLQLIIAEEGRAEGAGGAWCASPESCARRAASRLGSTDLRPSAAEMEAARSDNKNGSMNGMLSSNRTVNPDFYNWNAVYFYNWNASPYPMAALFQATSTNPFTSMARHSGAVALLVHCDGIKDTLKALSPSVGVRCLADSSMFLNV
ncbi:unnamed protein product [Closterium sp. Naga37s-1]|nr:unnamed protein product [Closterium sp. Naga37s-1]